MGILSVQKWNSMVPKYLKGRLVHVRNFLSTHECSPFLYIKCSLYIYITKIMRFCFYKRYKKNLHMNIPNTLPISHVTMCSMF